MITNISLSYMVLATTFRFIIMVTFHYKGILTTQIHLILSCHLSLSAIALSKCSKLHSITTQSWWMSIFAGQLALVCPCVGVHWRMLLMSLSLLFQQCPTYLTWIVCQMGGKWPYNCFVECCIRDLLKKTCSLLQAFC